MKPETQLSVQLIEKRVTALRALAEEILASQNAWTQLDVRALQIHVERQEELATVARCLEPETAKLGKSMLESDPESAPALSASLCRLARAQAEVKWLNQIQARLLLAWRCSINLLMSFTGTYSAPNPTPAFGCAPERETEPWAH